MNSTQLNEIFRMAELSARLDRSELTAPEKLELERWVAQSDVNRKLFDDFRDDDKREQALAQMRAYNPDVAWENAKRRIKKGPSIRRWWMSAAAIIVLAIGTTLFLRWNDISGRHATVAVNGQARAHDVPPGGNKAILTLSNGQQITLDSNANGLLAQQGKMQVFNSGAGQLAYKGAGQNVGADEPPAYNTLTTPNGGQYQVTLPDGTKVWLNAASSLDYPVQFTGSRRTVMLTGEAYFEVVHNASQPFVVKVNGTEIQDVGTAFNIMAYNDEAALVTTVVDGTVRIKTDNDSRLVNKDRQGAIDNDGKIAVSAANLQQALAWKDNHFRFHNADIAAVMRQISRWYDVSVTYDGLVTQHFSGVISRDVNVSIVFQALERTGGVHFTIEGRHITVSP